MYLVEIFGFTRGGGLSGVTKRREVIRWSHALGDLFDHFTKYHFLLMQTLPLNEFHDMNFTVKNLNTEAPQLDRVDLVEKQWSTCTVSGIVVCSVHPSIQSTDCKQEKSSYSVITFFSFDSDRLSMA